MANISVLIPSRSHPASCATAIEALYSLAHDPDSVEVVCRLDEDDPEFAKYPAAWNSNRIVNISGPRMGGYRDLNKMYEECALQSTGDVILIYNDDLTVMTQDWDTHYLEQANHRPLQPMCCHIIGDHYQWAFPAISRELYERVGNRICPGNTFVVDRLWHHIAMAKGWTDDDCKVGVMLHHNRVDPEHGPEDRKLFLRGVNDSWEKLNATWRREAEQYAKLL